MQEGDSASGFQLLAMMPSVYRFPLSYPRLTSFLPLPVVLLVVLDPVVAYTSSFHRAPMRPPRQDQALMARSGYHRYNLPNPLPFSS